MPSTSAQVKLPAGELNWRRLVMKLLAWASLLLLLALVTTTLRAAPATTTYVVNDPTDLPGVPPLTDSHCAASNGKCTLRAAVMEANHTPGSAIIILPAGTYSLTIPASGPDDETTGDLNSNTNVSIQGAGASSTIIDANGGVTHDRAFFVNGYPSVLNLSGVTIRGGDVPGNGGGIWSAGTLSLDNSVVVSNTAGQTDGGGLYTSGTLVVTNSFINGNHAVLGVGGGIAAASGTIAIVNSTIAGNQADFNGGGLDNGGATLSVYSSTIASNAGYNGGGIFAAQGSTTVVTATTISGNTATTHAGGGLAQNGGTTNLVNSTVSGNNAVVDGGGIWNSCPCSSEVNLYNVTVTNNQADSDFNGSGTGGGVFNYSSVDDAVQPQDSLIAGNWATFQLIHGVYILRANDCHGPVTSLDYNLIGTNSDCTFTASPEDQLNVPANIGPLQANGGPTLTHALLPGSLAVDAGAPSGCRDQNATLLATDQRGFPRTANGAGTTRCDIGAFELQRILDLPLVRR